MKRAMAALAVLSICTASSAAQPDPGAAAAAIVDRTNAFRQSHGLAGVQRDPRLDAAARGLAEHMARTERYGHQADGREPAERAAAAGYACCMVSENIAYIHDAQLRDPAALASAFVANWIDSPGHRGNMVDADVTGTGVAVATGLRSGRQYAVQMFARPTSDGLRFSIANRADVPLHDEIDGERHDLPPRVTRSHERCRASPLLLRLPGQAEPVRLQPADGRRWTVERSGGALRVHAADD